LFQDVAFVLKNAVDLTPPSNSYSPTEGDCELSEKCKQENFPVNYFHSILRLKKMGHL